jgi:hypothetical protein
VSKLRTLLSFEQLTARKNAYARDAFRLALLACSLALLLLLVGHLLGVGAATLLAPFAALSIIIALVLANLLIALVLIAEFRTLARLLRETWRELRS